MRIAICLSGLVRTYRQAYIYWQSQLYGPNSHHHHHIDTFISTWRYADSLISHQADRLRAHGQPVQPIGLTDVADLQRLYQPVKLVVEDEIPPERHSAFPLLEARKHRHGPCVTNVAALLNMLYKVYACDRDRRDYERQHGFRYDCVIRTRFDLNYHQAIAVDQYISNSPQDVFGTVVIPTMDQPAAAAVGLDMPWANDKFCIASSHTMSFYSSFYTNLQHLVEQGVPVQPEVLLYAHLRHHRLTVKELGRELEVVR